MATKKKRCFERNIMQYNRRDCEEDREADITLPMLKKQSSAIFISAKFLLHQKNDPNWRRYYT
jgi:hypothetical protein